MDEVEIESHFGVLDWSQQIVPTSSPVSFEVESLDLLDRCFSSLSRFCSLARVPTKSFANIIMILWLLDCIFGL